MQLPEFHWGPWLINSHSVYACVENFRGELTGNEKLETSVHLFLCK